LFRQKQHFRPAGHQFTLTTKLFAFEDRKVLAHCKQVRQIYTDFMAGATINRDLAAIFPKSRSQKEAPGPTGGSRGWGAG
jgi:hypothetical protein